jgi:hypothetical protein
MFGPLGVGDVCAVDVPGLAGYWINIGAALRGKGGAPATHVVVVTHMDARHRWWGIQGQPGGVAEVDMAQYWGSPTARYGNSNHLQPRTNAQRAAMAHLMTGLLNKGYDWIGGIAADGFDDAHLPELADMIDKLWGWGAATGQLAPAHLVCSAVASWGHKQLGLAGPPGPTERVQPADWWQFNAELR